MGSQVERTPQGGSWQTEQSHVHMQITGRNNWGERQTAQPRVPAQGNKASKPLTELRKQQEKLPASQERSLERPTGS